MSTLCDGAPIRVARLPTEAVLLDSRLLCARLLDCLGFRRLLDCLGFRITYRHALLSQSDQVSSSSSANLSSCWLGCTNSPISACVQPSSSRPNLCRMACFATCERELLASITIGETDDARIGLKGRVASSAAPHTLRPCTVPTSSLSFAGKSLGEGMDKAATRQLTRRRGEPLWSCT